MTFPAAPQPAPPSRVGTWAAEAAGTFVLVFELIGAATFSATHTTGSAAPAPIGTFGVAVALGVSVIVGAYAFGPISGGHFNPAVSFGLSIAGRLAWRDLPGYVVAQLVGGTLGAAAVAALAAGGPSGTLAAARSGGFASNGYGAHSPGGFSLLSAIILEVIGTAVFVYVILGVTNARSHPAVAPIPIGVTLSLLLLIGIPIDNAGFNPARSVATALVGGAEPLTQLWVFVLAPLAGAAIAGATNRALFETARRSDTGAAVDR
jgi:aquaporin Z